MAEPEQTTQGSPKAFLKVPVGRAKALHVDVSDDDFNDYGYKQVHLVYTPQEIIKK